MKKIYLSIVLLMVSAAGFAQINVDQAPKFDAPLSMPSSAPYSASRGVYSLWFAYDTAEAFLAETSQTLLVWRMNRHYSLASHDTGVYQRVVVKFDQLFDVYSGSLLDRNLVTNMVVDSFYTFIGHVNHSGTNDTLITRVLNLDANRYPGNTTLWTDTAIANQSISAGGDYHNIAALNWIPNYSANMKGFAVELNYYGSEVDTCVFVSGFTDKGPCAKINASKSAYLSAFYPNSFAANTNFVSTYPLLPTSDSTDVYFDCNNNGGAPDAPDAGSYIQNIVLWAFVTVTTGGVSVDELKENGFGMSQNIPNPAHNASDIHYQLAKDAKNVTLAVYDLVGNKVMEVREGNKPAGKYIINLNTSKLAAGMYTYSLRVDGNQLTKKMIIE